MTKEEAINWLKQISDRHIHGGDEAYDEKRREAIDMAIFALGIRADMPPDNPLTLEGLREMDRDKIYVHYIDGFYTDEDGAYLGKFEQLVREYNGKLTACELPLECYGKTWIAYRRKPKGGRHGLQRAR